MSGFNEGYTKEVSCTVSYKLPGPKSTLWF